jgi:carbon storage regulator
MLVMRRREGEAILIGDDVEIRILSINRARVKIGITAPRAVPVTAREVELVRSENRAAAEAMSLAPDIVARLLVQARAGIAPAGTIAEIAAETSEVKDELPEA